MQAPGVCAGSVLLGEPVRRRDAGQGRRTGWRGGRFWESSLETMGQPSASASASSQWLWVTFGGCRTANTPGQRAPRSQGPHLRESGKCECSAATISPRAGQVRWPRAGNPGGSRRLVLADWENRRLVEEDGGTRAQEDVTSLSPQPFPDRRVMRVRGPFEGQWPPSISSPHCPPPAIQALLVQGMWSPGTDASALLAEPPASRGLALHPWESQPTSSPPVSHYGGHVTTSLAPVPARGGGV